MDRHGIRPDPDAVEAVLTWKSPKMEHQLMSFLGFANYYREFIKGYADKVYPMQLLMRHKGKKFTWNNAAEESFQRTKKELDVGKKCRKEIETLLDYDMMEPSKPPWACGVVIAKKKGDQLMFCCEFRYLNSDTLKDAYPIPRIDENLSKLGDAKFFRTLI